MASRIGKNISVSIFGQSHSVGIGCVVEGIPAGKKIDLDELQAFLSRRAPGGMPWSTPRKEADLPEFLGGLVNGVTCGAPLAALIRNTNTKSSDYDELRRVPRPGHADYVANMKFHGAQDVSAAAIFRVASPLLCALRAASQSSCCAMRESKSVRISHALRAFPMMRSRFMASRPRTFTRRMRSRSLFSTTLKVSA